MNFMKYKNVTNRIVSSAVIIFLVLPLAGKVVAMDTVPVGNPENAGELSGSFASGKMRDDFNGDLS